MSVLTSQLSFSAAMRHYESSHANSHRIENGIFYTDVGLAEMIIKNLNIPKEAIIYDPCCGAGCFLYAASENGHPNIYGADCDGDAISLCANYLPTANLKTADTINAAVSFIDDVDFVIGNPPYAPLGNSIVLKGNRDFREKVAAYGNNLFVAALIRALELARKDGGVVSYIIPKNFLHVSAYSEFRKELLRKKTIVSIADLGICFRDVRGEQIVLTVKNTVPSERNEIIFQKYVNGQFVSLPYSVSQSFYTDEILIFSCKKDHEIYEKLTSSYKSLSDLEGGYVGRGKSSSVNAVSGKDIRKFGFKTIRLPSSGNRIFFQNIYSIESGIIGTFGGELEAGQTVTIFTDGDENMCRFILGLLHSRLVNFFLCKFCFNNSHLTMHTDAKYLKKIPLPRDNEVIFSEIIRIVSSLETDEYMSPRWFANLELLNATVYRAYSIDTELVKYIDNEMKATQSSKWHTK